MASRPFFLEEKIFLIHITYNAGMFVYVNSEEYIIV